MKFCEKCEFYRIEKMIFVYPIKISICRYCYAILYQGERFNDFYNERESGGRLLHIRNYDDTLTAYCFLPIGCQKELGIEDIEEFKKKIERLEYTSDCKYCFERKVEE